MILTTEKILLISLPFLSIIWRKTLCKFWVPTLLLSPAKGIISGSDGISGIRFDEPKIVQSIGITSLNFILFYGVFYTNLVAVKPFLKNGFLISIPVVLLTAVSLATFVWLITDFTIYESLLLGSIVSSTNAAVVF